MWLLFEGRLPHLSEKVRLEVTCMEFEDYVKLGNLLKEAERIIWTFQHKKPKKARINEHFRKATRHLSEVKNHLEEMLYIEFPTQFTSGIFYGEATVEIFYGADKAKVQTQQGS
jgi:hypothetical protein